jgi:Tfp pilus assembly protein PilF
VILDTDSLVDLGLSDRDLDDIGRARAAVSRADGKLADGDGAGAERLFQSALEAYPGYLVAYRGLGRAYALQGNAELAVSSLETYLRHAPPGARDAATVRRWLRQLEANPELRVLR